MYKSEAASSTLNFFISFYFIRSRLLNSKCLQKFYRYEYFHLKENITDFLGVWYFYRHRLDMICYIFYLLIDPDHLPFFHLPFLKTFFNQAYCFLGTSVHFFNSLPKEKFSILQMAVVFLIVKCGSLVKYLSIFINFSNSISKK